jgi:hypothetical protein
MPRASSEPRPGAPRLDFQFAGLKVGHSAAETWYEAYSSRDMNVARLTDMEGTDWINDLRSIREPQFSLHYVDC